MSTGLFFWVIMLIALFFGGYNSRANLRAWAMGDLVVWILLALLGWQVFGPALHR